MHVANEALEGLFDQDGPLLQRRQWLTFAAAAAVMASPGLARAQQFPSKPIRLLNGFAAGGGSDNVVRLVTPALAAELKATLVVENKTGASGMIAVDYVVKAPPDGYTLLMTPGSSVMIAPQAAPKPTFDALTDLVPINTLGGSPLVISAHPSLKVRTLKELIALSRTRPISIASAGTGTMTHLVIELLIKATGDTFTHVSYKGSAPGIVDAIGGHVDAIVSDISSAMQHFSDGRLIPLAVTSEQRFDLLPNVPTANDTLPGVTGMNWTCAFAPAKTPQAIVDQISAAMVKVVARDDIRASLKQNGLIPITYRDPEAFRKFVVEEYTRWGKLIRERNIVAS
ncbi:tripartite tricarboxylate transporter substrate binding protein [Variovorax rhizosphaerae]|uniref:Tripartite tricarboxylate transporter substrate binding protein n=1 Tax=Variovorax rhizosphaerae TaxID=1836200 RepID=A0ABU8WVH1_9BURK